MHIARKLRWTAVAGVLFAAVAATATAGTAVAATAMPTAAAPFAAQAKAAGLTAAQAETLQSEVNGIIAQDGGKQVAANEIALPHGSSVLLVLPGRKYARVLPGAVNLGFATESSHSAATVTPATTGSFVPDGSTWYWNGNACYYHYLCTWQGQAGTGTQFNVSTCDENQELPGSGWNTYGSWLNNQTAGVSAYFLNQSQQVYYTTPGAGYWNSDYDWGPIWYLDACV